MAARAVVDATDDRRRARSTRSIRPSSPSGTFHAGTKRNIIADEAKLELTVRSYKPEVQKQLLAAIERIAKAEAAAAARPA